MDNHPSADNLVDLLIEQAKLLKRIFFVKSGEQEDYLTFRGLFRKARQVMHHLKKAGMEPGEQLILSVDDNQQFLVFFWGCILGGIIPVPLNVAKNDEHKKKFFRVFHTLDHPRVLLQKGLLERLKEFAKANLEEETFESVRLSIIDIEVSVDDPVHWQIHQPKPQDTAFIQFSSGSTGDPKGVVLTHQNILDNIRESKRCSQHDEYDKMLSWMPLTHDMGLIGFHLNPLFCGMDHVIIPTELFVRRPTLWLDKATEHQSTILCSPNFGYSYLLKQLRSDTNYTWDLSHVRLLYNGAEPISVSICKNFMNALASYGLKSSSMYPVYGLAEATLAVAFSGITDKISSISVDRRKLKIGMPIDQVEEHNPNALTVVKIGTAGSYTCEVQLKDDQHNTVDNGKIGHVHIKGNNVTKGYFNNSDANERLFVGNGWLKTGDLGFFVGEDFYIVGRSKDVIFANGQNYYAHDIEATLIQKAGLEIGKVAISSVSNDSMQDVLLVFTLFKGKEEKFIVLVEKIRRTLTENFDFEKLQIIPVRQIPKTTSGKVERYRLTQKYEAGDFREAMERIQLLIEEGQTSIDFNSLNDEEKKLVLIWKGLLGHEVFDTSDSFFSVGGNSLKAGQLLQAIKRTFNVTLTFEALYDIRNIQNLATKIKSSDNSEKPLKLIPKAPAVAEYPATNSQKGIYYAWTLDKQSTAYNVPILCKIHGVIDPVKWQQAFDHLIDRHRILKCIFRLDQDELFFSIQEQQTKLELVELPLLENAYLEECTLPFDLHLGPLFRAKLIRSSNGIFFFFFDVHHSICDGISTSILIEELVTLYQGASLSPVEIEFSDVAHWQKNETFDHSEIFWKNAFDSSIRRLEFPADPNLSFSVDFEGDKQTFLIDQDLTQKIRAVAEKEEVSPFILLFATYSVLLSKYTNNEDYITGVPVAGRTVEQLNSVVGMLVNNLALRCQPQGDHTFKTYLKKVKSTFLTAFEHQDFPFDKVMELLKDPSDVHGSMPVNTMFTYQHMAKSVNSEDFTIEHQTINPGNAKFDLSFEVFELEQGLELSIEYKTRIFQKGEVKRIYDFYIHLVRQVVSKIDCKISELSLLEEKAIQNTIYSSFNQQVLAIPTDTIHELFDQQVGKTPDAIAISDPQGINKLTYKELKVRANQLANHLAAQGVGIGNPVMVFMDQSPEFVIAILAILKSGNHFVPVDTSLPSKRITHIITHCQTTFILSETTFITQLHQEVSESLNVIDVNDPVIRMASCDLSNKGAISDIAYLIYTSGTTGEPKGVIVQHVSLINYVFSARELYLGNEKVNFPFYTSISFDLTLTSIFVPLLGGHVIITYPQKAHEVTIAQVIEDNRVEVIKATPTHLRAIRALPVFQQKDHKSKLKKVIVGGEQLLRKEAQEFTALLGGHIEIYNEYGPTEATVGCMIHRYQEGQDERAAVPIGKPFPNTRTYLLNKYLQPVPAGLSGELYIAGTCLAQGYLHDDLSTSKKFISDPFHPAELMYKTGDLARRLPNGDFEFLGRIDRQTKVNGYRIELDEIESALLALPTINEAIVLVQQHKNNSYIAAYVVPEKVSLKEPQPLLDELRTSLPHYMLPRQIELISEIPITSNGKVAYDQLRPISYRTEAFVAPGNEIEKALWNTWKQVLGHEEFGIKENFYSLGGDSIKAIQVTSRLINENIALSVKDLLSFQSIEKVSKHASFNKNTTVYDLGPVNEPVQFFPIHHWFFEQQFQNPHWYNQSVLLKLKQNINAELISASFQELRNHHDGLRLVYDHNQGCLIPKKLDDLNDLQVAKIQLTNWNELPVYCEKIRSSMDIQKGPLFGIALFQLGEEQRLFITIHHLLTDGVSWRILLEDFHHLYLAKAKGSSYGLSKKTAPLHLWHKALSEYNSEDLNRSVSYWDTLYNSKQQLPLDQVETSWLTRESRKSEARLNRERTLFLLNESHEHFNVAPQVLMIVTWLRSLKAVLNRSEFVMEVESHGRHLEKVDVSRTIGWFTSLYPIKFILGSDDLQDNFKEIKNQFQLGVDHGFGYGIRKYLNQDEAIIPNGQPIDLRFNFLGSFQNELNNDLFEFDSSDTGSEIAPENKMTAKLDVNSMVINDELFLSLTYHSKAYNDETIDLLLSTFKNELILSLDHISQTDDVVLTSSDIDADMDQDELDSLFE